jgi:glycosyltransferase involved in cell wall biosynthesis
MTWRILFPRLHGGPTGGEIKFRDYFDHCLAHPRLDPYMYVSPTPQPSPEWQAIWADIHSRRVVREIEISRYDALFLGGINWELVPDTTGKVVLNLIQHVDHGDPRFPRRFAFLRRFAHRICVSRPVHQAIAPHAVGPITIIPNGIPLDLCVPDAPKREGRVVILARKQPDFGRALAAGLVERGDGVEVEVVVDWIPRAEFLAGLASAQVFVGLPNEREGFYLPALEAMASGCAVVCADAIGNRDFCLSGVTCLQPRFGDLNEHVVAVLRVLADSGLRSRIRAGAIEMAKRHSLDAERQAFHRFVDDLMSR